MSQQNRGLRTRRTLKACVICHKKKIRCDIDQVHNNVCTPCIKDGYECVLRERKRKRFTFSPSPPAQQRVKTHGWNDVNSKTSPAIQSTGSVLPENGPKELQNSTDARIFTTARLAEEPPLTEQYSTPGQDIPKGTSKPHHRSSNSISWLGRLEYLRNDVPVTDDACSPATSPPKLTDTDLAILRAQRVCDLPPRNIRDSLIEAFWTHCYPWTPVVERGWLDQGNIHKRSLLLEHAIMLAGSRVSPALQDYPPIEFYKKAKVLFWMGTEEDPIITIAATLLLHWWNPEGPEKVSLDTSGFWSRICIGLAYQIGLHREPMGRSDAGLRRRIWWSLVVRDNLINAGHGRPRATDLELADVSPVSTLDFDGAIEPAHIFSCYVGVSCILGDLTQSYLRKHALQEQKRLLEDRLFRWCKTLPEDLRLCHPTEGRPLKPYNSQAWQLHIQYFSVIVILHRSPESKSPPPAASLLASSFIAGIFEDLMARNQLKYLGPIFTFYCLAAGMVLLSGCRYSELIETAEQNLSTIGRALEELGERWPSAVGSLKHLMDVREKIMRRPSLARFPDTSLPTTAAQVFSDFGPELCHLWHPIHQRLSQATNNAPKALETAGILQGLRTPASQGNDLDIVAAATQQPLVNDQMLPEGELEPPLLQPQGWLAPYGGMGNWLMVDWDQSFDW